MYQGSAPSGIEEKVTQALGVKKEGQESNWAENKEETKDPPQSSDPKVEEGDAEPTIKDEPPSKPSQETTAKEYDEYN